ncbi:hypothetical protein BGW42_007916 [Actinomortierella wolfii]|nr:hypothetical protein BGW42_007916 [Actinomortierella wolfii]
MSSNSKHIKESKNSTKPETTEGTDASPAGTFSILTLRSVIVLVVILCVAIQFYSPWTTTQLFDTFLNAGNTDRASPSTQTGAAGETRTSGSGGKDGWASSTEKADSSSVPLASSSPVMFGTPDPQPSSAPFWPSSSREDTQDSHRQKRRRNESPFQDFFDQSNGERSKAPDRHSEMIEKARLWIIKEDVANF